MTEIFIHNEHQEIIEPSHFGDLPSSLIVGFTTRKGGVSKNPFHSLNVGLHVSDNPDSVIKNRERLAEVLQMPLSQFVCIEQVHGSEIVKVDSADVGSGVKDLDSVIKGFDGCYTFDSNVLLTTFYADCVPLYFYTEDMKCVGLAHAGWKGTALMIGPKMVKQWVCEEGIPIEKIHCIIGPSIGPCCYEVDDYVISRMSEILPSSRLKTTYREKTEGKYSLDLNAVNMESLLQARLQRSHIHTSSFCTSCEEDLFFSYRRDGGTTGRMMSYIGLRRE